MNKRIFLGHVALLLLCLGLDLWSKYVIYDLGRYNSASLIDPILNTWISFSIVLSWHILVVGTVWALVAFWYFYYRQSFSPIGLVVLIAWTLGNFIDRLLYEGVRDFLVMPNLFIYNLADVFLSVGVLLIILEAYRAH